MSQEKSYLRLVRDILERLEAALADRYTFERKLGRGGVAANPGFYAVC